jgi:CelD/BcsL family acetyltransferase involved in cellulose biosynthesis
MQTYCLTSLDELAPYADDWDRLAGSVPFRSWAWLSTWWRHYGQSPHGQSAHRRLHVYCVFDPSDALVAIAPWYLERSAARGRALRVLGSGEVCTDYPSVLCRPGLAPQVADLLADRLTEEADASGMDAARWDLLDLGNVDAADTVLGRLADDLAGRGHTVHRRAAAGCWRLDLPADWEAYLKMLSKRRRHRLRRLDGLLAGSGRAVLHCADSAAEVARGFDVLLDLHQRRRQSLGQTGCFASRRFTAFHREIAGEMFRLGQLQLAWIEIDGRPAAVEYQLLGGGVVYGYQSGIEPALLDHEPGNLLNMMLIRRAIEQGFRAYDFLRGDERYKASFRATRRPQWSVRVAAGRAGAQWRHNLWLLGGQLKRLVRSGRQLAVQQGY